MASVSASEALIGQAGDFNSINYSGTFIPTLWSARLNVKFYAQSTFADCSNTNWEGEIKSMGDKVIINNVPDITITDYVPGTGLTYQVPTPSVVELAIDKAKYFAFQLNDVIAHQSKPNMMDTFSTDAAAQMKMKIDTDCWLGTFSGAAAANIGATAGATSASYNLGTDAAPLALDATNILATITAMSSVLDEQNVPEGDRFLVLTPYERQILMNSSLAQAQFMGDAQSILRNGKIGRIDRFDVYVSTLLPKAALDKNYTGGTDNGKPKRHVIVAGHRSAMTFASQFTKTETVRSTTDFGDYVRGLMVYGYKVVKDVALTTGIIAG
jgi:hypothetical protein